MWDDFLREDLGRVDVVISEEDGDENNSNPNGITLGEVLEDESDCGLCYSDSVSDHNGDENDLSNAKVYQSPSGRRKRPRAEASADKSVD